MPLLPIILLDEDSIMNRSLATSLLLFQKKWPLETMVQSVAKGKVPNELLLSALYCFKDKIVTNDKYAQ